MITVTSHEDVTVWIFDVRKDGHLEWSLRTGNIAACMSNYTAHLSVNRIITFCRVLLATVMSDEDLKVWEFVVRVDGNFG